MLCALPSSQISTASLTTRSTLALRASWEYLAQPQRRRAAYYGRILDERRVVRDGRRNERVVKRAVSAYPVKRESAALPKIPDISEEIVIVK